MAHSDTFPKELIATCLSESKKLSKKDKNIEALAALDKISHLSDHKNPLVSLRITKQISTLCNQIVLTVQAKVPYLRRAEQTLMNWVRMAESNKMPIDEKIFRLILLTYNNWATFHQTSKNYHMALSYLMKGLQMIDESEISDPDSFQFVAKTKLNVSALYSELHRFQDAIQYAEDCLSSLQLELRVRLGTQDYKSLQGKEKRKAEDMITTYVIAFYNIGVAQEMLNNQDNMRIAFKNAVNIGINFLDPNNEILITAKKALSESMGFKSKTLITRKETIRISPEKLIDRHKAKAVNLPLSVPSSEAKIIRKSSSANLKRNFNNTGRYYNEARLKKIQEKLEYNEKLHFISADQYFYKEISKLMDIGSDIKYLRPLTTSGAMTWWDKQNEEKRKISDLRLKKQHRWNGDQLDQSIVAEKIERLKMADEEDLRKQEVKLRSKMKTKVYKQIIRFMSKKNRNYTFPPQSI
jgi:hypothetical protein